MSNIELVGTLPTPQVLNMLYYFKGEVGRLARDAANLERLIDGTIQSMFVEGNENDGKAGSDPVSGDG